MKFAVVEYSSKSQDVWQHTDARPNYLADPQKEIDPTSFGCYVSALKGEHVPVTGFIVGPVERVSNTDKIKRKIWKRITGHWPTSYSIDYIKKFNVLLVVHQLSDAHEMATFIRKVKEIKPHMFIIGVPTQPFGILKNAIELDPEAKRHLIQFIDECDVFIVVVKDTVTWYASLTSTAVVYVPQPYPLSYTSKFTRRVHEKEKSIMVAGVTQRDNIKQGHIVARELQRLFPDYMITIPKVDGIDYDVEELRDTHYKFFPFQHWKDHLQTLATTKLVINTDYTYTRGRVQMDCAAVGTACLGGNSDAQKDLFLDLASKPNTPLRDLVRLGKKLLTDNWYYEAVAINASERLQKYDYEDSAARMYLLVKTYKTKKEP